MLQDFSARTATPVNTKPPAGPSAQLEPKVALLPHIEQPSRWRELPRLRP